MRYDWRKMTALDGFEIRAIKDRLKESRCHIHGSDPAKCYCENFSPRDFLYNDVKRLLDEMERLKSAMRVAMSDMPSDQSRGYETLSLALGEP